MCADLCCRARLIGNCSSALCAHSGTPLRLLRAAICSAHAHISTVCCAPSLGTPRFFDAIQVEEECGYSFRPFAEGPSNHRAQLIQMLAPLCRTCDVGMAAKNPSERRYRQCSWRTVYPSHARARTQAHPCASRACVAKHKHRVHSRLFLIPLCRRERFHPTRNC